MYHYKISCSSGTTYIVLLKSDGTTVASYTYNPWGKIISITDGTNTTVTANNHVALVNPFRYRGYVFDDETGLYYLMSRYYDPTTQRFINADTYVDTLTGTTISPNMFSYCENNPLSFCDPNGCYSIKKFNCYAYAFGISNRWMIPGHKDYGGYLLPKYYSVSQVIKWVLKDFGNKARRLKNKNDKLKKGEYRIAVRICYAYIPLPPNISGPVQYTTLDFHFWKQDPKTLK